MLGKPFNGARYQLGSMRILLKYSNDSPLGKDRIEGIIKEEMGHIQVLTKELMVQTR